MRRIQVNKYALALTVILTSLLINRVNAQRLAITNATVYTASEQGILTQATIIIENDKIVAINPSEIKVDETIDAKGRIVTPGFIASMNLLGLVEVGAVATTQDDSDKKAGITFDASLAFNPKSTLIAYARKGGITSNIVAPKGGKGLFAGQTFTVNLSGEYNSIIAKQNAVLVHLGAKSKGSRAQSLQLLDYKFADAQKKLDKLKAKANKKQTSKKINDKKPNEPKRDELVINALLAGEKPLLAYANRATDLLALMALKKKYNIDLVFVGASDAVLIADEIAAQKVPVIISAINNLPRSFDSLHGSLTNAATLVNAGVKVLLMSSGESHNINQLRYDAGIAVANGLDKTKAITAITANIADVFKLNSGRVLVGKNADLVLWSGDPFEFNAKVDVMWINGKVMSTQSRQDALRKRYTSQGELPKAYTK
ncbi:MAG: amidohydrolase family protein [Colwellia sp.]